MAASVGPPSRSSFHWQPLFGFTLVCQLISRAEVVSSAHELISRAAEIMSSAHDSVMNIDETRNNTEFVSSANYLSS